jgi:hypothetical protein
MIPKKYDRLFARRPTIFIGVVLGATLLSAAYEVRTDTILSCQADGYTPDRYIAYCNGKNYGDYEHGAFHFHLEPSAESFAKNADVLFLGNSRLQVAFSTAATANWFSAVSARYYLLGFSGSENVVFAEDLLRRIRPQARVYVINVDDFFERVETPIVKRLFHDPEARNRYEGKQFWQHLHEPICKKFAALCGGDIVIFRSRATGAYIRLTPKQIITPVSYDQIINQNVVNTGTAAGIDFLSHLSIKPPCVILTMVPTVETKIENVKAIATSLGQKLVTPDIIEGLQTYDASHLDQPSAQRWSQAFFQAASARIRSCLEESRPMPADSSL